MSYSDGERREVARKLREIVNRGDGFISSAVFSDGRTDQPSLAVVERLADLIDPQPERTCQIVSAFDTDELEDAQDEIAFSPEDTLAYMCKSCGFDFRYERGLYPNYCPNCGAKVVEDR